MPEGAILFSCQPDSFDAALAALRAAAPGLTLIGRAAPDAGLVLLPGARVPKAEDAVLPAAYAGASFAAFAAALWAARPVFVRHICPLDLVLPALSAPFAPSARLDAVLDLLAARLPGAQSFSVQLRALDASEPAARAALGAYCTERLAASGVPVCRHAPDMVCSVTLLPAFCAFGLSSAAGNGSVWPGGEIRYRQEDGQISRAAFKLLETLDTLYAPPLAASPCALDLGAAPGGWTQVLLRRGYAVTAVDPAALDTRLTGAPHLTVCRMTAERFLERSTDLFDLIVNDMKLDAADSARIMVRAARCLAPGGAAVMTLKLHEKQKLRQIRAACGLLSEAYDITALRQLFHNRSEVTAVLRPHTARSS